MELSKEAFQMQEGLLPTHAREGASITVFGIGGIGSFLGIALAKMGFKNLCFIDFDRVAPDQHNSVNSLYGPTQINLTKTKALAGLIKATVGDPTSMTFIEAKLDAELLTKTDEWAHIQSFLTNSIVISAVDNMDFRNFFGGLLKEGKVKPAWYIDSRMGAEIFVMYTIKGDNKEMLDGYCQFQLFPDKEGVQERCTERSILYTPFIAAGLIARQVRRIVIGKPVTSTMNVTLTDQLYVSDTSAEVTKT